MTESQPSNASQERLNQIVADHLAAEKSGNALDRDQLLANDPDLAKELKAFFANHDRMHGLAEQPADAETIPPKAQNFDPHGETLPPTESADSAAPSPGTKVRYFGDYELLEEIARGGMGVVYKARQAKLNRLVALKMILSGQLASQEDMQRFCDSVLSADGSSSVSGSQQYEHTTTRSWAFWF